MLREGLLLARRRLLVGFAGAVAIRRALETQLFGVRPLDPLVLALWSPTLIAVALDRVRVCRRGGRRRSIR